MPQTLTQGCCLSAHPRHTAVDLPTFEAEHENACDDKHYKDYRNEYPCHNRPSPCLSRGSIGAALDTACVDDTLGIVVDHCDRVVFWVVAEWLEIAWIFHLREVSWQAEAWIVGIVIAVSTWWACWIDRNIIPVGLAVVGWGRTVSCLRYILLIIIAVNGLVRIRASWSNRYIVAVIGAVLGWWACLIWWYVIPIVRAIFIRGRASGIYRYIAAVISAVLCRGGTCLGGRNVGAVVGAVDIGYLGTHCREIVGWCVYKCVLEGYVAHFSADKPGCGGYIARYFKFGPDGRV